MIKKFTSVILCFAVFAAMVVTTACPTKTAIRRANEASYQLAGTINDAQKALEKAFDQKIISADTAKKLNNQLRIANEGSAKLTTSVKILRETFDGKTIPQNKLDALNLILSDEIVTPVLKILDELKIVDASRAPALLAAISSIKTLILVISSAFPQKSAQMEILQRREVIYG